MDFSADGHSGDLQVRIISHAGVHGARFFQSRCVGLKARTGQRDGHGHFILSLTLAGQLRLVHGHQPARTITPESGLLLLDTRQPIRLMFAQSHEHVYLVMPRPMVETALGRVMRGEDGGVMLLPGCGLRALLCSHLRRIPQWRAQLSRADAQAAIGAAVEIAIACLRAVGPAPPTRPPAVDTLVARAGAEILRRLGDPGLCAEDIALALNCSRAHLYRAFAARGLSVGAAIREARIERARQLILERPCMPLAEVGLVVGYASQAGFSRAFRRKMGCAPGIWMHAVQEGRQRRQIK